MHLGNRHKLDQDSRFSVQFLVVLDNQGNLVVLYLEVVLHLPPVLVVDLLPIIILVDFQMLLLEGLLAEHQQVEGLLP
jgi:hypothetical protein